MNSLPKLPARLVAREDFYGHGWTANPNPVHFQTWEIVRPYRDHPADICAPLASVTVYDDGTALVQERSGSGSTKLADQRALTAIGEWARNAWEVDPRSAIRFL